MELNEKALLLRSGDHVAVARTDIPAGVELHHEGINITVADLIPAGHKLAVQSLATGEPMRKYAQIIGFATQDIRPGQHVHLHNLEAKSFEREYAFASELRPVDYSDTVRTFQGYRRADGRVATRNYIALVSTVNCSATVCRKAAQYFDEHRLRDYPNVDGVIGVTHRSGCSMASEGEAYDQLQRTLAGTARHANVFGYIMVGLGCETNQPLDLLQNQGLLQILPDPSRPPIVTLQEAGGTRKAIHAIIERVEAMLPEANRCERSEHPVSELMLATECGGSDAYSGITANPGLGVAADELVRHGGTVILGETPEMYGAEHLLTRRSRSETVGKKLLQRIEWWEHYSTVRGAVLNNNPSAGNKDGGLTTIYEKSLGAIAKGGTTPVNDVYVFADKVTEKGLVLMDTPGYDPPSVTGMCAGGANVVAFTTGRGSAFGFKPVPSIKIATNTVLYEHMEEDMDINAGIVLEGASLEDLGCRIFDEVVAVASGKRTKSELLGYGDDEFCPWEIGPVL